MSAFRTTSEGFRPGTEIERLVSSHDWALTELGPMSAWAAGLHTLVPLTLRSPLPAQLWWGREPVLVAYSESLLPLMGARHPGMIGARASDAWPEVWEAAEDRIREVLDGEPGFSCALNLPDGAIDRGGDVTFHFAPVCDDRGGSGVFVTTLAAGPGTNPAAERAKDEFLAMLGHELRNPLAPITTALYLLALRSGAEGARERAIIERQVSHLTRLVDDLLDVSRITRGKLKLELRTLEIREVIAKAIEMASPLIEERRHELELDITTERAVVRGDPTRLAQVFANLLNNAAKYTNPEGKIEVCARAEAGDVVVIVRDDGIGIAPEMLPTLFEPFSQERQSLDRSQGGLGLGLAIVDGLVRAHGGMVTARSNGRHRGSEFVVSLPLCEATPEERTEPALLVRASEGFCARILVVDDNRDAATLLGEVLSQQGHDVRVAFDGFEALQIARTFLPEVLLLDLGLPVVDGFEVCRRIRSEASLPPMKIAALSGYGTADARRKTSEAGFDAHLVKPVSAARIAELIRRLAGETSPDPHGAGGSIS